MCCHASFLAQEKSWPEELDLALLAEMPRRAEPLTPSGTFAYCFDRELRSSARQIVALVQKLSGARPVRVDWNKRRFPKRLRHKDFICNIQTIAAANFCLTDLYHLTANAINLGVPVICCGQNRETTSVTTNSDKKLSLLSQFGLQDLYIKADSNSAVFPRGGAGDRPSRRHGGATCSGAEFACLHTSPHRGDRRRALEEPLAICRRMVLRPSDGVL